MKVLSLVLITNLSLFLSFLIHAEAEEPNVTAETFLISMLRGFDSSFEGDKFLLGIKNIDYFYCEGKGTMEHKFLDRIEETSLSRMEFIIAYKDKDEDEAGWFALSDPATLDSHWLFIAFKKISEEKWINIWDSKYSMVRGSNPMEDAVKATINAFVLRIDINKEVKNTENLFWEKIEDIGEVATLSTDWFITMNRNTKKFYWQKNEKKIMRLNTFPERSNPYGERQIFEGDCSITKR